MDEHSFSKAREFTFGNARLLEQRAFATLFEGAPAQGVVDALGGYQNEDGGFGHGLEPDKRCPASLPIDVEIAFETLVTTGARDEQMVTRACDYLTSVATPEGAVPLAFPIIEAYPRAEEWSDWTYVAGVFPTASLVGFLYALQVEHAWRDKAAEWCWATIESGLPDDVHALSRVAIFLTHVPDQGRAMSLQRAVAEHLPKTQYYRAEADDPAYGLTPLNFAPTPESPWRSIFDDAVIAGHLERLERDQQDDGGWAITWEPPSPAAVFEYRGVHTLWALRVLRAYGRI